MRTRSNLLQTEEARQFQAIKPKRKFLEEEEHLENNKKEKKKKRKN